MAISNSSILSNNVLLIFIMDDLNVALFLNAASFDLYQYLQQSLHLLPLLQQNSFTMIAQI